MVAILVGAALGFLSGLGVGGGSLLLLWLTVAMGRSQDTARAMNLLFFLPCALIATVFRWKQSKLPSPSPSRRCWAGYWARPSAVCWARRSTPIF